MLSTKFRFIWPNSFKGEEFKNQPIRNKNRLWWPCLLMELERNEYSLQRTAHRCFLPSFGSFGQAVSEEKNFKNQSIRNKNCLWWPCLLMDRDKISNLRRGPAIDTSHQVSVHLAKQFQRRRILKSANQKQESPVAAMFVNGSGRNEQSLQKIFHRCFLPSFGSFGHAVSEEKIFKNRSSETRIASGGHVC